MPEATSKEQTVTYRPRHRRALYAAVGAVLALIAAVIVLMATADDGAGGGVAPVELSAAPLGLNVSTVGLCLRGEHVGFWRRADVIQPLLKAAGIDSSVTAAAYADYYDWQTNTILNCLPDDIAAAPSPQAARLRTPLDFSQFSQQARAIGADSFVTVNYGSGTPAEAAAWVGQAKSTPGRASRCGRSATRPTAAGKSTSSPGRQRHFRATPNT